jgi:hypothetical protein
MNVKTTFKGVEIYASPEGGKLTIGEISVDASNISLKDYAQALREAFRTTKQVAEENDMKVELPFFS